MLTFKDYLKKQMEDPEFAKYYNALQPYMERMKDASELRQANKLTGAEYLAQVDIIEKEMDAFLDNMEE